MISDCRLGQRCTLMSSSLYGTAAIDPKKSIRRQTCFPYTGYPPASISGKIIQYLPVVLAHSTYMPASIHSWDGETTVSVDPRPSSASNPSVPTLTTRSKSTRLLPVARSWSPRQELVGEKVKKPMRTITPNYSTPSTMLIPERPIVTEPTFRESLWAIFCCSCMFWFCRASAWGSWPPAGLEYYAHLHSCFSEWLWDFRGRQSSNRKWIA